MYPCRRKMLTPEMPTTHKNKWNCLPRLRSSPRAASGPAKWRDVDVTRAHCSPFQAVCRIPVWLWIALCLPHGSLPFILAADAPPSQAERVALEEHFEKEIRPTLIRECLQCHGEQKQEAGLRLDSLDSMLAGGESGPAVKPGNPEESLLMEALKYTSFEMPPTGPLPPPTIRQFETWIAGGAVWPEKSAVLREESSIITDADRQWWAFQPVVKSPPPVLPGDTWSVNPMDQFVLKSLVDREMQPAPAADQETLIRRVFFDLIGLPPSPQEIDAFLEDTSPNAWESLVDRLLDDPRYGEHWARYWLDLVRFSESDGWNQDAFRPYIWRYRDYVINALNSDKPYPDFVREQIAGDEMSEDNPDHWAAAGFYRLGIYEYNQRDARGHWNDIMNEMTDVTGDVFLGMSMACARCHDHKFDPISQVDYFKLRAFLEPIIWRDDLVAATEREQAEYAKQLAKWEEATASIRTRIDALLEPYYAKKWESTVDKFPLDIQACFHMPVEDRTSWQHQMAYLVSRQFLEEGGGPLQGMSEEHKAAHQALEKELAEFDNLKPEPLPALMTVTEFTGMHSPTLVQDDRERTPIAPGFLSVLSDLEIESRMPTRLTAATQEGAGLGPQSGFSGRRTALADWIGSPQNPLTTRVIVNRVWQQHFGQGLVATSSDFGIQGTPPSHPELLDWLTADFIETGWSLKKLHKQIVMSATWRQSAEHPLAVQYQASDPAEQLLWRARVRRLQAEQIRDAMLVASSQLDARIGGPSVDENTPRRALYVKSYRNKDDTFLHGFDVANGLKSIPIRDTTTTPTQALLMINGEYALGQAKPMAERLTSESDDAIQVARSAFRIAWGREPQQFEMQNALQFLNVLPGEDVQPVDFDRLVDFCHILFNSNQFLYVQ